MLRADRLLDLSFPQPLLWQAWDDLRFLLGSHHIGLLAGCHLWQMAALRSEVLHGTRHRRQVVHHSCLCSRVRATKDQRCSRHPVANVSLCYQETNPLSDVVHRWTAFGIMLGFVASVAFYPLRSDNYPGLNWRLMLASTAIPPIFVCAMAYVAPESPRWLLANDKFEAAFASLCRLRKTRLQAARDLYDINLRLQIERRLKPETLMKRATALFSVPRNRRAAQSSFFVMFMQQFCGVNVIAYYSSEIFRTAGFTDQQALLASLGTGIVNW